MNRDLYHLSPSQQHHHQQERCRMKKSATKNNFKFEKNQSHNIRDSNHQLPICSLNGMFLLLLVTYFHVSMHALGFSNEFVICDRFISEFETYHLSTEARSFYVIKVHDQRLIAFIFHQHTCRLPIYFKNTTEK